MNAQAESAVRARERDIERLRAAVDGVKGGEVEVRPGLWALVSYTGSMHILHAHIATYSRSS